MGGSPVTSSGYVIFRLEDGTYLALVPGTIYLPRYLEVIFLFNSVITEIVCLALSLISSFLLLRLALQHCRVAVLLCYSKHCFLRALKHLARLDLSTCLSVRLVHLCPYVSFCFPCACLMFCLPSRVLMFRFWAGWASALRTSSDYARPLAGVGRCALLWRSFCCRSPICSCWMSRQTIWTVQPRQE